MKRVGLSFFLSVFVMVLSAQDVLTISDENISLEEFKSIFYKNNNNTEITKEYLEEYMDLFVNYNFHAFKSIYMSCFKTYKIKHKP